MPTELNIRGRIGILGAGREGMAAFEHLRKAHPQNDITVISEALTGNQNEAVLRDLGVLKVCPFDEAGLDEYDWLIRSPGISCYRRCLQRASAAGVGMTTPSNIWFDQHPLASTIVITGTKGKSTTAALLAHLLKSAGLKTRLAGNIGTPLLGCDDEDVDWWVVELSSYQLADLQAQPTIGVLLNLATDHLDWHGTEARYHADKLRLAGLVRAGDLIANGSDSNLRKALAKHELVQWFDGHDDDLAVITMPVSLPGRHNRENLAACMAVLQKLGIRPGQVSKSLAGFEGLPHRLKSVGEFNGVEYVNDSISTAPVATIAALEAYRDRQVILLIGGFERGIDWDSYAERFQQHPPLAMVALPDNGPGIVRALEKRGIKPELGTVVSQNLAQAMEYARQLAPPGSVVLLSPGAPSFPQFKDYEDRGQQFAALCSVNSDHD